ncbi:2OG-Fe dioxygenase family protein [Pseudomonas corrugata]|uniref:2OG-Fe dioxygenase family protein n=1 Tax=Pseudomonas corrugata TaxID=47879 RepID=UPI0028C3CF87|nr:2OG-Fe dioxygenase family protein [Pseudomonas corrugata]MDU9037063.1 2OG-Fe dioxygenase family protein [Pseudomonas corrugata]
MNLFFNKNNSHSERSISWNRDGFEILGSQYYKNKVLNLFDSTTLSQWHDALEQAFSQGSFDHYSTGNRIRCHINCKIEPDGTLSFGKFKPYMQPLKFNPITGGLVREYSEIHSNLLNNGIFLALINEDIQYASTNSSIDLSKTLIGIHLMRYAAKLESPAYSSPPWLHKDKEEMVFIHHINTDDRMIGGDSILAKSELEISRVFKLEKHLDSFVMSHRVFHAVSPMGCNDEDFAYRDIILVTFERLAE